MPTSISSRIPSSPIFTRVKERPLSQSALNELPRKTDPTRELLALYEKILLVRLCEEKIRQEYSKDEMKTPVHLGIGGEAIAVGVIASLPKASRIFGTYRNHA